MLCPVGFLDIKNTKRDGFVSFTCKKLMPRSDYCLLQAVSWYIQLYESALQLRRVYGPDLDIIIP